MGCDIHMMAQRREARRWVTAECPRDMADPYVTEEVGGCCDADGFWSALLPHAWWEGRNYILFSVLAGVRNGYGFAGVKTTNPLTPIAEPRGLPADVTVDECGETPDKLWLGDHSHSWLTLREIVAYDWDQTITRYGVVPLQKFKDRVVAHGDAVPFAAVGRPYEEWSGGISGPGIYTLDAEDALGRMRNGGIVEAPASRPHVRDCWTQPLRECVGDFLTRTVPALQSVGDLDDVRIVFGFDS